MLWAVMLPDVDAAARPDMLPNDGDPVIHTTRFHYTDWRRLAFYRHMQMSNKGMTYCKILMIIKQINPVHICLQATQLPRGISSASIWR